MKKAALIVVSGLAVIAIGIQLVPVSRTNPPVVADFDGPAEVRAVFRKSCYDCHSNETRWPWYSHVAPSSWLVAHDVEEARDHFNFSLWGTYSAAKQAHLAEDIWDEVKDGDMPLLVYRLAHRGVDGLGIVAVDRATQRRVVKPSGACAAPRSSPAAL